MKHTIGARSNPTRDLDCNTYTKESDNNNSPDRHHSVTVASNLCQVLNLGAEGAGAFGRSGRMHKHGGTENLCTTKRYQFTFTGCARALRMECLSVGADVGQEANAAAATSNS